VKKFVLVLLLFSVVLAGFAAVGSSYAQSTATVSVDSATQQFPAAEVGQTIQINITVSNVQNLWAWYLGYVNFNPAILNLTNVIEGPFLIESGQQTLFYTALKYNQPYYWLNQGYLYNDSDILLSSTGVSGNGVIETLCFQVLAIGTSQINFGSPTLDNSTDMPILCNAVNTTITVGNPQNFTPSPSPSSTSSSSPTPVATASSTSQPSASPDQSAPASAAPETASPTVSSPSPESNLSAPEFPITLILALLIIAVTASTLLIARNAEHKAK